MLTPFRSAIIGLSAFGLVVAGSSEFVRGQDRPPEDRRATQPRPDPKDKVEPFKVGPDAKTHYVVDAESRRNEVAFVSRAPRETINGKSKEVEGVLDLNPRKLDAVSGRFAVAWKTLDTGNPQRNEHLLADPWVNAAEHPDIVFTLTGIEKATSTGRTGKTLKATLVGTMAMNGHEKELKVPATLAYVEGAASKGKKPVKEGVGIRANFRVALADFDIKGRGVGQAVAAVQQVRVSLFLARAEDAPGGEDDKRDGR